MAEAETGELEAAPVTAAEHLPEPAAAKSPPRKSAWVGSILGGVIAAAAGYGVAQYVPKGWPLQDTSALESALAAQAQETAMLKAQLAALAAKPFYATMTRCAQTLLFIARVIVTNAAPQYLSRPSRKAKLTTA